MARFAGVDLPRDKRIEVALTYIYGIGPTTAKDILEQAKNDVLKSMDNLSWYSPQKESPEPRTAYAHERENLQGSAPYRSEQEEIREVNEQWQM